MKKFLSLIFSCIILVTAMPLVFAEGDTYKVGDIVQFGSYPQSGVKDEALIAELNALAPAWNDWISYGYYSGDFYYGTMVQGDWMRYTDVTYNGSKYRGIKFTQYRPYYTDYQASSSSYTLQDSNGYSTNIIYWFEFESINWRVLDPVTGFVMCETIIDSQPYSNTIYYNSGVSDSRYAYFNDSAYTNYASDYKTSSIRKWLNNDFYNTAFTDSEKKEINTTTLNNNGYYTSIGTTGHEKLDSKETNDKIFLLSYNEARNSDYGFNSSIFNDINLRVRGSDYAQSQGLFEYRSSGSAYDNNSDWLLRSPGAVSNCCCSVTYRGQIDYNLQVYNATRGIRPALCLNRLSGNINLDDTPEDDNPSENVKPTIAIDKEKLFTEQHLGFINGIYNVLTSDFRFANTLWENMNSTGQNTAEFVHDIIEGFVEVITFKGFDGLESIANPYDAILLDFLAGNSTGAYLEDACKNNILTKSVGLINDLITMCDIDEEWSEDFNLESELESIFTKKDFSDNRLYKFFNGKIKNKNIVDGIFNGFDCYSKVSGKIADGLSVVDYFFEMLRYTAAIEAYYNSSEMFKLILSDIASEMYSVNNNFAEKFNESLNTYSSCLGYDDIVSAVLEYGFESGAGLIQNLTSDTLSKATYSMIIKAFKVSKDVAGKLNAALWATDVGFSLSNLLTGNDTLVNCRRLLRANYMLDVSSYNVMKRYETVLKNKKNYGVALLFDSAFSFFKNVQVYSLDIYRKYCETSATKLFSFKKAYFKNELQETVGRLNTWKSISCHNYKEILGIKTFGVAGNSAVNIYRKSDNALVGTILNGKTTLFSDDISAISVSGEISVALSSFNEYTIKLTANQDGYLSADYAEYENFKLNNEESFATVNATAGKTYTVDTENNTLNRDDGVIYSQDGGITGCSCNCHAGGIKAFFFKILNFFQKLFGINKICACGVKH